MVPAESEPDWYVTRSRNSASLGPPALDALHLFEVWVCVSDNLNPFIKLIGVATVVVKMVVSDLLIYYFIKS